MGAAASWVVPTVLGIAGLKQSSDQAKAQQKAAKKAGKVSDLVGNEQLKALQSLNELAANYDPKAETQAAVDQASKTAAQTLEQAFANLRAKRGSYTGDTEYAVSAQRGVNDSLDPLKLFAANEAIQEPWRKAQMHQMVLGAPTGQIADNYFKSSAILPKSDPSASLSVLAQALTRMLAGNSKAGGRGDTYAGGSDASGGALPPVVGGPRNWSLPVSYGGFGS